MNSDRTSVDSFPDVGGCRAGLLIGQPEPFPHAAVSETFVTDVLKACMQVEGPHPVIAVHLSEGSIREEGDNSVALGDPNEWRW